MNKDRPISTLLKNQIRHLQEAEFRLPVSGQTDVYINSIKTEGEAAEYIRKVTAAIHEHHAKREVEREAKAKPKTRPKSRAAAKAKTKSAAKKKKSVTTRAPKRS
jgi:ArsR family metal-binding transcriptional regulator